MATPHPQPQPSWVKNIYTLWLDEWDFFAILGKKKLPGAEFQVGVQKKNPVSNWNKKKHALEKENGKHKKWRRIYSCKKKNEVHKGETC